MAQPSRVEIHERALAQPFIADGEIIDYPNALALFGDLEHDNLSLYAHIQAQIIEIDGFWEHELGANFNPNTRRQIVARAVIAGAAQVLSDTGQCLSDLRTFRQSIGIQTDLLPLAETDSPDNLA